MSDFRRPVIFIGLVLWLGLPFCHLGDLGKAHSGLGPLLGGEVLWAVLFVAILLYVLLVEREPLASIGFRRPGVGDLGAGLLAAVISFLGIGIIVQVVLPLLHMSVQHQLNGLYQTPLWFRLLTVTRAAFAEETAFRGYGYERLRTLTGSGTIAALATWALFTIAHLGSWGVAQVVIAAFGGLVLTLLYVWRRNLWGNILAHWLVDGAGFILVPLMMAHK